MANKKVECPDCQRMLDEGFSPWLLLCTHDYDRSLVRFRIFEEDGSWYYNYEKR